MSPNHRPGPRPIIKSPTNMGRLGKNTTSCPCHRIGKVTAFCGMTLLPPQPFLVRTFFARRGAYAGEVEMRPKTPPHDGSFWTPP